MNKSRGLVCLLFVTAALQAADSAIEEKVKAIRGKYAEIEKELKDCRQVKREVEDESTEGGELTAYFKDSNLRKLSAQIYGEMGKHLSEFYFSESQLVFVFSVVQRYDKPFGAVKSKTEERFYFADGKLIRWLNSDKKEVTNDAAKPERERELLAAAKKYSDMATR